MATQESGTVAVLAEKPSVARDIASVLGGYQGRYLNIGECGTPAVAPQPAAVRKPVRKDHNAGGKSSWMEGFFDRPSPPLWKAIGE